MFRKALLGGVAFAALSLTATGSAFAQYDVNSRIDALEHELRELKSQVQTRDAKIDALEQKTTAIDNMPKFDGKKLELKSADGKWSIRAGGRVQLDASVVDADDLTAGNKLSNGLQFRRARLYISGKVDGVWKYKLQGAFDSSGDGISIDEANIEYVGIDNTTLTVGKFKHPYSLEEMTSSRDITFLERSLMNVFAIGKQMGGGVSYGASNFGIHAGYFFDGAKVDGSNGTFDNDNGLTLRGHFAPIAGNGQAVHIGLSAAQIHEQSNGSSQRIRQRPEIGNADRLMDTTITDLDKRTQFTPELAAVFGPFSAQAEYTWAELKRKNNQPDVDMEGGYILASYFLTGESRPYDASSGKFGRVKSGWEVAARYSYLDFSDGNITPSQRTGKEHNYGVALNYYINENMRAMLNYVYADFKRPTGFEDEDLQSLMARIQVDF